MNELILHSAEEVAKQQLDYLLVTASAEGHYVTGKPGFILLYVRNDLKRRSRTVTVSWEGERTITVGPRQSMILGPFGMTDLEGGIVPEDEIRVDVTYPDPRGLRFCAMVPPTGQTITTTSPVFEFGIPRPR